MYEVKTSIIPLHDDFSICPQDYDGLKKNIFLANPNAHTGLPLSLSSIESILCQNKDRLVVVDEAYVAFGAQSAVSLIDKYDNLLVVGTFSKARSLAGARFGYAVGNLELIKDLSRMKYGFNPYNVNSMTMAAAKASLEDVDYYETCLNRVCKTRDKTTLKLEEMGFCCTKSVANFLFIKHKKITAEFLFLKLRDEGILVRWFKRPKIENHLRVSVGTEEEMEQFVNVLQKIISKKYSESEGGELF